MLNLILSGINGYCAVYLALTARKVWKSLPTGLRTLDVAVVVVNVMCCAMNLVRALR